MITILLVAVGGAVGAPLRYHLDRIVSRRTFPRGTLLVNVIGCFLLGYLVQTTSGPALALLGTGFCGALTTYSTFGYETVRLLEERRYGHAAANVAVSVALGFAAALLGIGAGRLLG